jgi:hypothetical protein
MPMDIYAALGALVRAEATRETAACTERPAVGPAARPAVGSTVRPATRPVPDADRSRSERRRPRIREE